MSPQAKRTITTGVVTTLLGVAVVWLVTTAANAIVPRAEYDLHVQAEAHAHERAARADSIQSELLLDIRCAQQPTDRRCR